MSRPRRRRQPDLQRMRVDIAGVVQGVGFRPFVYREAKARRLSGFIANTPQGVSIEVEGEVDAIAEFLDRVEHYPPPNAKVEIASAELIWTEGDITFEIRDSVPGAARGAEILPDLAICDDCAAEIRDSRNRRFRYPFTNCTRCGPRFSIIRALPYDRSHTTMAAFPMCAACRAEYEEPSDRRFHAEPIACPDCGPKLAIWSDDGGFIAEKGGALNVAAEVIRAGRILAVKGLGGFHLMVDARNEGAVRRLRQRKRREEKPFAVMYPALSTIKLAAEVSDLEAALLTGRERPIVLLRRRGDGLAEAVAPGNPLVGAMVPYTPLHMLLLDDLQFPVVATSGNRSDEPIVTDEGQALERLAGIADALLVHDRPILRPVDDSVVRVIAGEPTILRRARGYAPSVVAKGLGEDVLAVGGHLKATIALGTAAGVVISQHLGDLDTPEARDAYGRAIEDLSDLHAVKPRTVVRDLHPDYHSTRVAEGKRLPTVAVQHHVAHVAACMAEHGLEPPLIGVAWDGTGYGTDGAVWGGEFLLVTETGWRRAAHLRPFRLPGGEAAVREPRRSAVGLLHAAFGAEAFAMTELPPVAAFAEQERSVLAAMLGGGTNASVTTSAGRLFDAVAALTGLRQRSSYEGQAAMEVEWAALRKDRADGTPAAYPLAVDAASDPLLLDWEPALRALLADVRAGVPVGAMSMRFHAGLARGIADIAARIGQQRVVLTGGCFQNAVLTGMTAAALAAAGMTPVCHAQVPANDGGIALGQLWWASRFGRSA